jgi:glutamate synthase domain-containing protein 1
MYHFAVVALFGLAILKLADLLVELVPSLGRTRTLLTFAMAIAATVAVDYSLFAGFGVELREQWMGPLATGTVVGSLAGAWAAVLGWLDTDRTETTDRRTGQARRIAA